MWTKRIALIAVILTSGAIFFSQAAQQVNLPDVGKSGNDYLRACEGPTYNRDFSVQDAACRTYTQGVVEGLTAYQIQSHSKLFTVTLNMNESQVQKIIVKYMNDHPKDLNLATSQLILWALMDAYPAPKK
jgi:hypothetical protein